MGHNKKMVSNSLKKEIGESKTTRIKSLNAIRKKRRCFEIMSLIQIKRVTWTPIRIMCHT